jgi:hypothetical protein
MASQTLKLSGALKLGQLSSAPADPAAGLIYYNSSSSEFQFYNGSGFVEVADFGQLGSTANGFGASLVGIEDSAAYFAATNVESALAELYVLASAGGSTDFADDVFRISDDGDSSKKIAFQASGISASTVRTITMPDANVDLGNLTNSNISATAAIAYSKLAALTTGRALQSNASTGFIEVSAVTNTELGYLSGVTSAIQTQLNAKAADNIVIKKDGSVTYTANQPMGGFKLTGLGAGSGAGDSVRYEQAILVNGANAFSSDQSMGGNKLTNLADPTSAQDAATKAYVDMGLNGIKPKQAVRAASTADLDLSTDLENGDSLDGVTLATGDRVLVKDQSAPEENGIYIVAASGAASRATDFDSLTPIDEINGSWVAVQEGSQAGTIWVQYGTVATIGTDPINFTYVASLTSLVGGDMITVTGASIAVDLATVSGLESSNPGNDAGQLRIKLEASNPSLQIDGSNQLGAKLYSGGALVKNSSGLLVNTDGTTIEVSANAIQVKDNGISDAKLRDSAALSVIGRSTNSSGDPADIAASNDNEVLRRSGTSLGFGLLVNANIDAAAAIAYSKLALSNSIVNADINASAAIAGTKISPDFGSQNLRTTGSIFQGAANGDIEEYWLDGLTLTGSASGTALTNLTFDASNYGGLYVVYQIKDTSNKRRRTGWMLISANEDEGTLATATDITDVSSETGDVGVSWAVAINSGNVEVRYTTTANNKLFSAKVFKMRKA